MRGLIEYITIPWIHVVQSISQLVMVVTEKRWRYLMLTNWVIVLTRPPHQILWVDSVHTILPQAQQPVGSVGIGSLITVHSGKLALAMGF